MKKKKNRQRHTHNLREFVLNSRHPGPRRVWKVGSVARWLPPLPASPAGSGSVYQTMVSCTRNDTFPSPKALKSLPGQGLARGSPMGAKGTPKGTQREPSGKFRAPSGTILDDFGFVFPQHVKIPGKENVRKNAKQSSNLALPDISS